MKQELNYFLLTMILCCVAVPAESATASHNEVFQNYLRYCQAQADLENDRFRLEKWRLGQIEKLQSKGFASWQELQKQSFAVDSLEIKTNSYRQFVKFLKELNRRIESRENFEDGTSAVKVFLPGSNRLIGWLNGVRLPGYSVDHELTEARNLRDIAKQKLVSANQKYKLSGSADNRAIMDKSKLALVLAQQNLAMIESKIDYLESVAIRLDNDQSTESVARRTVTPNDDPTLQQLVFGLAEMESQTDGYLKLVERHLARESKRLNSLRKLSTSGHASDSEIKKLAEHVDQLKSTRDEIEDNLENLAKSLDGLNTKSNAEPVEYLDSDINNWPEAAFRNSSRIQYLVEQRQFRIAEESRKQIAIRKLAWMNELVSRLKNATGKTKQRDSNDRFAKLIDLGQRKEIEGYKWKIESLNQSIENSEQKVTCLRLEENRFLKQLELMDDESDSVEKDQLVNINANQLLTSILSTVSPGGSNLKSIQIQFGYNESNILDTVGTDARIVFSQNPGYPLSAFSNHDDLLRPVRLTNYSRSLNFARRNPVRLSVGPATTSTITRYGIPSRTYQTRNRDIAAPSLFNSPYATDQYRSNQYRNSRFYENAYPFGILRSDLRRFSRFSQPPWYLPGSPDNLRSNQLRTDYKRNLNGHSGYNQLKSKNYLDLSRPDYVD